MVYTKKNKEEEPKDNKKKRTAGKKRGNNPLNKAISDNGSDKRKARKDFFDKKSEEKKRFEKKSNKESSHKKEREERSFRYNKSDNTRRFNKRDTQSASEKQHSANLKNKEATPSKTKKRNVTKESEILSEIISIRRKEGRGSERKPKILSLNWNEERGPIRLNKYIANAGICSRREADTLIEAGAVTVNGIVVTELGTKVMPTDEVRYEDKILQREKPVYLLLNKPKDYITTTDDEHDRKHVMMLVKDACPERIYPVGRLDRNTTGLLLFTNDGEMAKKLTHPRYGVRKIYHVELDRNLDLADFEKIVNGLELNDGVIIPDEVMYVGESKKEIGITLHSGKNRIVRRIFEHLGYKVEKLDRVVYANLTKKDLPRGHWRFLKKEEINILKMST